MAKSLRKGFAAVLVLAMVLGANSGVTSLKYKYVYASDLSMNRDSTSNDDEEIIVLHEEDEVIDEDIDENINENTLQEGTAPSRTEEPSATTVPSAEDDPTISILSPSSAGSIRLQIDGRFVDLGKEPLQIDGRLLVPVRVFAEFFGAIVHWEDAEQKVTVSTTKQVVELFIDEKTATIDGQAVTLDVAATLHLDSTYVPLRFLGEALGVLVHWDNILNLVTVSTPAPEEEPMPEPEPPPVEPSIPVSKPAESSVAPPLPNPSTTSTVVSTPVQNPGAFATVTIGSIKKLETGVELVVTGTTAFEYTTTQYHNPERYVLDLPKTLLEQAMGTLAVNTAGIIAVRYAHHDDPTVPYTRIVLDMEGSTQGLQIIRSNDGKTLTIRSSYYYVNSIKNQRLGNGEEITFSFDGRVVPRIEAKYLNSTNKLPVQLPSSLVSGAATSSSSSSSSVSSSASSPSSSTKPASSVAASSSGSSSSASSTSSSAKPASSAATPSTSSSSSASESSSSISGSTYTSVSSRPSSGVYPGNEAGISKIVTIATTTDDLNFRTGPGMQFNPPITELIKGTEAELVRREGEWALLRLDDGREGWCHTDYLVFKQLETITYNTDSTGSGTGNSTPATSPSSIPSASSSGTTSATQPVDRSEVSSALAVASTISSGASSSSGSNVSASAPSSLPAGMKELRATEYGFGDTFRIYLPGVYPQIPVSFKLSGNTLIKSMTMTSAADGSWLNVSLKAEMPFQINMINDQLEIALNLDTKTKKLELSKDDSGSLVTLSMSRTVGYEVEFFKNPDRVVVTIPGAALDNIPTQQLVRDGLIQQIKASATAESVKVTIDLDYMVGYRVLSDKRSDTIQLRMFTHGLKGKTIYLDPGHGGNVRLSGDPGSLTRTQPVFYEATGTLDIALRLKKLLEEAGVTVLMTRSTDVAVGLQDRVDMANRSKADVLLSIHHNSSTNPAANGLETYYWEQTVDRQRLATVLQKNLVNDLKLQDRGVKREEFYPIKYVTMPSALVELGFISNPVEDKLIRDEYWRQRVAQSLFDGLKEFFNPE